MSSANVFEEQSTKRLGCYLDFIIDQTAKKTRFFLRTLYVDPRFLS